MNTPTFLLQKYIFLPSQLFLLTQRRRPKSTSIHVTLKICILLCNIYFQSSAWCIILFSMNTKKWLHLFANDCIFHKSPLENWCPFLGAKGVESQNQFSELRVKVNNHCSNHILIEQSTSVISNLSSHEVSKLSFNISFELCQRGLELP